MINIMASYSTNIHSVTNIDVENSYLPTTETHYTTITVFMDNGEKASLTLFGVDSDRIKMKTPVDNKDN